MARTGAPLRMMPNDPLSWEAVYQQPRRWPRANVLEAAVRDVRAVLRLAEGCTRQPSGTIADSRTLQSTPESGPRAGSPLGHLLAWHVTAARAVDFSLHQIYKASVMAP